MLIPTVIYGYLFFSLDFPVTERVSSGVSTKDMYKAVLTPLYIFLLICMMGTAITELFTNQWVGVLLQNVTQSAILVLPRVAAVQALARSGAGPVVHGRPLAGAWRGQGLRARPAAAARPQVGWRKETRSEEGAIKQAYSK